MLPLPPADALEEGVVDDVDDDEPIASCTGVGGGGVTVRRYSRKRWPKPERMRQIIPLK